MMRTACAALAVGIAALGLSACDDAPDVYGVCVDHDVRVDDSACDDDHGALPPTNAPRWMWTYDTHSVAAIGHKPFGTTRNLPTNARLWVGMPAKGSFIRGDQIHRIAGYIVQSSSSR